MPVTRAVELAIHAEDVISVMDEQNPGLGGRRDKPGC